MLPAATTLAWPQLIPPSTACRGSTRALPLDWATSGSCKNSTNCRKARIGPVVALWSISRTRSRKTSAHLATSMPSNTSSSLAGWGHPSQVCLSRRQVCTGICTFSSGLPNTTHRRSSR
ncbi:hypothetical protein BCR44DRAFT_1423567 [Catenaria anguillulae PL171]|uniref:Uncharacterized protein n=1 Tax=Catenaria anguillulae PL171 TaxID=765915 RepID=A0A1Y2I3Z7_9FUNG|nr:hypothetical protein BCR44DRAFT_1423567 [Catenaria anguillulae PL171]